MTKITIRECATAGKRRRTAPLMATDALGAAMIVAAAPAAADEISDLKAENAALKSQIEALARDLQRLRDDVHQNQQAVEAMQAKASLDMLNSEKI